MAYNVADYRSLDQELSMGLISKRPKLLLYAQNSPKDSIGQLLGTLPAGRFGRVQCWEATRDARHEFGEQLKEKILNYLTENHDKVQDSSSIIDLSLFMLGRSPVQAKPTVMFVSEDKKARKEAFDMIKYSGILEDYPGFELGHISLMAEFENLRLLAERDTSSICEASSIEEPLDVFSPRNSKLVGQRLYFYSTSDSEGTPQIATAGGAITYRGRPMLLTVDHFLEPAQTITTPLFIPGLDEDEDDDDECEITGLSEFEDEDEDQLAEVTSQGSITPEFEGSEFGGNESNNDRTSILSSGSSITVHNNIVTLHERLEPLEKNQASILPNGHSNEHCMTVGKAILRSKQLDYSLVEIDPDIMNLDDIRASTIDLEDISQIEQSCRDAAVKTTTPDGGIVGGTLSGTPSYVRLPHSRTFVEVYIARFNRPLVPGDCGGWVRDAVTGCLFGHIFAGSPTSGLTMIMPACRVFEDARRSLESQHDSEARSSQDILRRVDRNFLGAEGPKQLSAQTEPSRLQPSDVILHQTQTSGYVMSYMQSLTSKLTRLCYVYDLALRDTIYSMNSGHMSDQTFGAPEISHDYVPKNMIQCQPKAKEKALPRFTQKRGLKNIADGYRSPPAGNTEPPKLFGCPFAMMDPTRYRECSSLRLRRPSDISQHIARCHLLQEKTLVEGRDTIQPVYPEATGLGHPTCREYFGSKHIRDSIDAFLFSMRPQYAGTAMASICPIALCEPGLAASATTSPRQGNLILTRYPTQYRPCHFRDGAEGLWEDVHSLWLLKSKEGLFESCVTICNVDDYTVLLRLDSTAVPRLLYGTISSVLPLIRSRYYGRSLQQASAGGYGEDGKGRPLRSRAFEGGDEAIVQLLIARGAHTEAAAHEGLVLHEVIVRLSYGQGVHTAAEDTEGETALSYAAE